MNLTSLVSVLGGISLAVIFYIEVKIYISSAITDCFRSDWNR